MATCPNCPSISDRAIWFLENFKGVVANSLFSVYDTVLKEAVERLFRRGGRRAHDEQYHETPSGRFTCLTILVIYASGEAAGNLGSKSTRRAGWR